LQSLPPSYSAFVEGYVMAENNDNFHQCLRQLKFLKVERAAEKVVKPTGICDIQCYKCFINIYVVLEVWDTNSCFVENGVCGVKCSWRRWLWCTRGWHASCCAGADLPRHLSSSLEFWIKFWNQFKDLVIVSNVWDRFYSCVINKLVVFAMNKVFLDDYE
jgi:hypothetical protein